MITGSFFRINPQKKESGGRGGKCRIEISYFIIVNDNEVESGFHLDMMIDSVAVGITKQVGRKGGSVAT